MALTDQLDHYCERISPEFWSEPINAVTNAAFILAALAAFWHWRRKTPDDWPALFLIGVVLATGIGSFLFHTFATRWAMLSDVIPIAVFIHIYLLIALNRFLRLNWILSIAIVVCFFIASPIVAAAGAPLVGSSAGYLPALLAIFAVGGLFYRDNKPLGRLVLIIGIVFIVSLTFRTLDEPLCSQWALGTHFLWHIFNAIVLFGLLRVLIWHRAG